MIPCAVRCLWDDDDFDTAVERELRCCGLSVASITTTSTDGSPAVSWVRPRAVLTLLSSERPIAISPGSECPR